MEKQRIKQMLPEVMQRVAQPGAVLDALLSAMSILHRPSEELLSTLSDNFNPHTAPKELLPMLAHWTDMLRLFRSVGLTQSSNRWRHSSLPIPEKNLRELIANAIPLAQNRGTHQGMLQMLEIATGITGFVISEGAFSDEEQKAPISTQSDIKPFHIIVHFPPEGSKYLELIQRIVEQEKPAYVTAEIREQPAVSA